MLPILNVSLVNYTISTSRPALCMMQKLHLHHTLRGAHLVTDSGRESISQNSYKLSRLPIPDRSFGLSVAPDSSRPINIRASVKWNSRILITSS